MPNGESRGILICILGLLLSSSVLGAQNTTRITIPDVIGICQGEDPAAQKQCYAMVLGGMDHAVVAGYQVIVKRFDSGGVIIVATAAGQTVTYTGKIDGSLIRGNYSILMAGQKRTGAWTGILPPPPDALALSNGPDGWWYCMDDVSYRENFQPKRVRVLTDLFQKKDLQSETIEEYSNKFDVWAHQRVRARSQGADFGTTRTVAQCFPGVGRTVEDQHAYADAGLQLQIAAANAAHMDVLGLHWHGALRAQQPPPAGAAGKSH